MEEKMEKDLEQECTGEDVCDCGEHCDCDEDRDYGCHGDHECSCGDECECHEHSDKKKKKEKPKDQVKRLEEEKAELEAKLLMSKADFINYRKRLDDETSRRLKFCNEDLIKEVLPILDNFERAIQMDDENLDDEVSKFLSGFKMIYCNFVNILNKYDVVEIDGFNKPFDPTYHQAVLTEVRDDMEPGMVIEVLQKGYILKGKVIRPAMVRVSE